jgi:hypothetical protein
MAFGIEEQVLRLDVTMCNALAVKVGYSIQHLLETALDFARAHSTARKSKSQHAFPVEGKMSVQTRSSSAGNYQLEDSGGEKQGVRKSRMDSPFLDCGV